MTLANMMELAAEIFSERKLFLLMIYTCCWWVNLIGPKRGQLTCFASQAMASHKEVNSTTTLQ